MAYMPLALPPSRVSNRMRPEVSVTSRRDTPVSSTEARAWPTFSSVSSGRPDRADSTILTLLFMAVSLVRNTRLWDTSSG